VRTASAGWVLQRDAATIELESVYRLFVLRADEHVPARAADAHLETLVHELGQVITREMRVPLTDLFRAAEHGEALPREVRASAG
jgi:hypothetical protein